MQDTHSSPTIPSQSELSRDSNIHKTLSTSQLAALMRGGGQKLAKVTKYFQTWKQLSEDKKCRGILHRQPQRSRQFWSVMPHNIPWGRSILSPPFDRWGTEALEGKTCPRSATKTQQGGWQGQYPLKPHLAQPGCYSPGVTWRALLLKTTLVLFWKLGCILNTKIQLSEGLRHWFLSLLLSNSGSKNPESSMAPK